MCGRCATRRRWWARIPIRSECSEAQDQGLHGITGRVESQALHRREPALRPRPAAGRRQPPLPGARGRHAVLLAGRHLVDGAVPPAALAGGVPAARRRPEGEGLQRHPDRRRAVSGHAGRSTRAAPTRRAFRGRRITPASARSTSTPPTSAWGIWSSRASRPASSAPGATSCRGWAWRR